MKKFIIKRFFSMLLTAFLVATATYFIMFLVPGDPLGEAVMDMPEDMQANYMAKYGLDKPVSVQYYLYMKNLLTNFDFGESIIYPGRSVNSILEDGIPVSAQIGLQGLLFGIPLGLGFGILAANYRGKWVDYLVMFVSLSAISIPSFVFASMLQYVFAFELGMFPITGWGTFACTVLPSLSYGIRSIGVKARYMRTSWLDVMNQDYVLAAESIGMSKFALQMKVIFRNAISPIVTILVPELALIFTGTFVLEMIYSIPGIGYYFVNSVTSRDYPMIIGQTIFISVCYILAMFLVDILYMVIDPRVRLDKKGAS
ncbi:MAG: ABC transporter permease [Eubacteriales bacterium]